MEEAGKHGLAILGGETPLWKLICYNLFILVTVGDLSVELKMLPRELVVHIMGGALKSCREQERK